MVAIDAGAKEGPAPVVVGVDGPERSHRALAWAARYARSNDAPLTALAVWHLPASYGWALPLPDDWDPEADAHRALERTVREVLGSAPGLRVRLEVVEGPPGKALVDASRHASLVVVGGRVHGELAGVLFGSAGQFVVAHAHCPVTVVRGDEPDL